MEFLALLALICPIATGKVAASKGRSIGGWALAGLLLGPLGLIAACGAGDRIQQEALRKLAGISEAE